MQVSNGQGVTSVAGFRWIITRAAGRKRGHRQGKTVPVGCSALLYGTFENIGKALAALLYTTGVTVNPYTAGGGAFDMSRSIRLLALLQALRGRRRPVTAAVLAGMLEVSERPIYRDVAELV